MIKFINNKPLISRSSDPLWRLVEQNIVDYRFTKSLTENDVVAQVTVALDKTIALAAAKTLFQNHVGYFLETDLIWLGEIQRITPNEQGLLIEAVGGYDKRERKPEFHSKSANPSARQAEDLVTVNSSLYRPGAYVFKKDSNSVRLGLSKNATYQNNATFGGVLFGVVDYGYTNVTSANNLFVMIDFTIRLPVNWRVRLTIWQYDAVSRRYQTAATALEYLNPSLTVKRFCVNGGALATTQAFSIDIFNSTGGVFTETDNDFVNYVDISYSRILRNFALIDRNLTAAIAVGTNVTINVNSTANIVPGMRMLIDYVYVGSWQSVDNFSCQVLQVLNATQLVVDRVHAARPNGTLVRVATLPNWQIARNTFSGAFPNQNEMNRMYSNTFVDVVAADFEPDATISDKLAVTNVGGFYPSVLRQNTQGIKFPTNFDYVFSNIKEEIFLKQTTDPTQTWLVMNSLDDTTYDITEYKNYTVNAQYNTGIAPLPYQQPETSALFPPFNVVDGTVLPEPEARLTQTTIVQTQQNKNVRKQIQVEYVNALDGSIVDVRLVKPGHNIKLQPNTIPATDRTQLQAWIGKVVEITYTANGATIDIDFVKPTLPLFVAGQV